VVEDDVADVVGTIASVVEEVIKTGWIRASSMVVVTKLLKPVVNVKLPAMAVKSGMMAILFVWRAIRTPST